ncbi:protein piwi-like [Bradysia coprophila]|uniref:protein piwi-like n=1 Tax=Bradysia coprophila TaxID=38358 RepID=UPI00187D7B5D|nr:protein piwi-like [Bradysia coprophila]
MRRGQPDVNWNYEGRIQGRGRGSYYYPPTYSAQSPGYEASSREDEGGSRSTRGNGKTHYVSGRSYGYGYERDRERREMYDRSRERHENSNTERDANFYSRRSSSRSTYMNYETRFPSGRNGGNVTTSRREARYQPIDSNHSHRRDGNRNRRREARDMSINRNETNRNGNDVPSSSSSNGRTSQKQVLVQPMEWNALREGISDNNEACEKQLAGQSTNQRESENRALIKRTGLAPGNHTINRILQTNPDATASKQGTSGVPVSLVSNYFRVAKRSTLELYLYRVDFTPAIKNKVFQGGLLHGQMKNYGLYFFDGTMMYMMAKLEKDVTEYDVKGNKDDQHYAIKIKLVGLVPPDTYQYLHVWALLLRKCERALGLQLVGRNYYDPDPSLKRNIYGFNLELWPGFVTAIHQHEKDILLCVDVSTKVMRTDTVYDIMRKFKNDRELIQEKVLGMTVLTTYTNKTYRITDIDFNQTPSNEFDLNTGEKTSFIKYFATKYNQIIKDPHQPLLIVRSSQRQKRAGQSDIFALVPELCIATGFDDSMRTNHVLMKTVAKFTRLNPTERILRSQALIHRLRNNEKCQEIFKECEFQLDTNPTKITGRRLIDESVIFGGQQQFVTTKWSNQFHSSEMYGSEHLHNWILIYPQAASNQTLKFVSTLQQVARGMNYIIKDPYKLMLPGHDTTNYTGILDEAKNRNPQLIVVVLTTPDEGIYGCIKKYCIENAIQSQVLLSDTIKGKKNARGPSIMSVATKVVIQINCKLGGLPWMVNIPLTGLMTFGFDVFHNIKDKRKKSCGAIVATWDMMDIRTKRISQKYYSAVSAHISGNQLSTDLALQVCQAVREYFVLHKSLPKHILFYRDGVGEGQITYVKEVEIKNILDGLSNYYGDTRVPLTFILVTKRINTRFFVHNGEEYQNPQPGTVVDDVITKPEKHEFLLVSSQLGQGTVSPTNYNILLNNMGLSSNGLQRLTYKLTYLYYNWCGTLPVPAVCQYAHKLAFLVGNYGLTPPSNDLQKKLYFL